MTRAVLSLNEPTRAVKFIMTRHPARPAFTLVELLVVIFIVGLLAALLFTGIQAVVEAGRRNGCANKMRQVALAIQHFESDQRNYPGWRHFPFRATDAVSGSPVTFSTSWCPQLLPYLGRNDIFESGRPGNWKSPIISGGGPHGFVPNLRSILICPSDAERMESSQPLMSFVVNTGRRDGRPSASVPADWRSNGVFLDLLNWRGTASNRVMVQKNDSSFIRGGDGLATTLLISENYDAGRWFQIRESRAGFIFYPPGTQRGHRINSPTQLTSPGKSSFRNARPSSNHPGGVNVVFAGGNARFLSEQVDYAVYCALMTPRGESAREPGTTRPSDASITNQPRIDLD